MASGTLAPNFYGLITKERAEKFDLLGQLILNQRETIILCGCEGIGKTTLLKTFKKHRENIWAICLLQGGAELSFEEIQKTLISTIQQYNPELANHDLQSALSFCEQQQYKAVLMIDDAVQLSSGIIRALTEYALQNPILRVVFSFTRTQLYSKSIIDSVLDDCYFMEIPKLTKSQTDDYLQALLGQESTESEAIQTNDKLLKKLYRRAGGVPGRIIAESQWLNNGERKKALISSLQVAIGIGIVVMLSVCFWFYKTTHKADLANLPHAVSKSLLKPVNSKVAQDVQFIAKQTKAVAVSNTHSLRELEKTTEPQASHLPISQDIDEKWVLQQKPGKYTLQLMALSKRQSLEKLVKQHLSLQTNLKILQLAPDNRNQERYVLLYGSFLDTKTAYAAVKWLPAEFRQAWPRQFKALQ